MTKTIQEVRIAKHTAGPWSVGTRYPDDIFSGEKMVCSVYNRYREDCKTPKSDNCEEAANARLIAAAPDLLEAVERLLANDGISNRDFARAAIARAKGGK
jgi:hypothetical protein